MQHLQELRIRLIYVVLFFVVCFGVLVFFAEEEIAFFIKHFNLISKSNTKLIYSNAIQAFNLRISLPFDLALLLTLPFLTAQVFLFCKPALPKKQINIIRFIVACFPVLFTLGAGVCFVYIIPIIADFLFSFSNTDNIPILLTLQDYISLCFQMCIGFGIAFQTPIFMLGINKIGLVGIHHFAKFRRFNIVLAFILGAIFTPPDVLSQVILASILILLYEAGIIICKIL